jgi:hypothetical protein
VGKAHKSKKIIHTSFPPFFGGEAAVLFIYFYRTIEFKTMKNIVKIVLLFVCFCCHTAFIVQQKVAIESITPPPPQFYKPEKVNWFQKMVIKKNAQQLISTF